MKQMKFFFVLFLLTATASTQIKNPKNIPFDWKTDTSKSEIDLSEISVVLPRGSFHVLNYPDFIGKEKGLQSFITREPVMVIEVNGAAKAYPLNMLSFHEIANDSLAGIPIVATYCPLCNSGIVYDRRLTYKGTPYLLEFDVSGMLRKTDMVMADCQTESWWQQLMGKAIVGELAGAELKVIPSLIISVEEFFDRYPKGKIVSRNTGDKNAEVKYGINLYRHYDSLDGKPYERFFSPDDIDSRLPPMERVVDINSKGEFKIYPFSVLRGKEVVNDTFNSKHIVLFYKPGVVSILDEKSINESKDIGMVTVFNALIDGKILIFKKEGGKFIDTNTNSEWDITGQCIAGKLKGKQLKVEPHGNHFAFAWLAFHPDSNIFQPD